MALSIFEGALSLLSPESTEILRLVQAWYQSLPRQGAMVLQRRSLEVAKQATA